MLGLDFSKMTQKLKKLAQSKKALYALSFATFLEPLILPIVPEILIAPILLSRRQEQAKTLAIALSMTLLGSSVAYFLSYNFREYVLYLLSFFMSNVGQSIENMSSYGQWMPFIGSIIPMPFKLVCLSSGVLKIPFSTFILGIFIGRLCRYSLLICIPQKIQTKKHKTHLELSSKDQLT